MRNSESTFNILTDTLKEDFEGALINTDFKSALKFYQLIVDDTVPEFLKPNIITKIFFITFPDDPERSYEILEYFLTMGEKSDNTDQKKVFDFVVDAPYIYSAFMQVYNIDLNKSNMHWWKFLTLLKGLPKGTVLSDIIEIRSKETPTKGDPSYINNLRMLKDKYGLEQESDGAAEVFSLLWSMT